MGAALLYGMLAALALVSLRSWRWRTAVTIAAALWIAAIGFSRVVLGAHFVSDVLGAAAAGLAWLALSVTGVETLRRRRTGAPRPTGVDLSLGTKPPGGAGR